MQDMDLISGWIHSACVIHTHFHIFCYFIKNVQIIGNPFSILSAFLILSFLLHPLRALSNHALLPACSFLVEVTTTSENIVDTVVIVL